MSKNKATQKEEHVLLGGADLSETVYKMTEEVFSRGLSLPLYVIVVGSLGRIEAFRCIRSQDGSLGFARLCSAEARFRYTRPTHHLNIFWADAVTGKTASACMFAKEPKKSWLSLAGE
jgi:hypothetical protein